MCFVTLLTSCGTPRIIIKEAGAYHVKSAEQPDDVFVITKENPNLNDSLLLGTISTKHNAFTGDCNLRQVKSIAKKEVKAIGGNLIYITDHRRPNVLFNPCHRIRGKIYSVRNPEAFEKEILWKHNRKLKVADFKGNSKERPFIAATNAYFGYATSIKNKENLVIVEVDTYFDCEASYFKNNKNQSQVLNHEQLHFDITEIYARKFIKRIQREIKSYKDLIKKVERIGDEVNKELQLKQNAYDTDVYSDFSQQSHWDEWTESALKELDMYQNKTVSRPYKQD